jgi:hypothetical protein
MTNPNPKGGTMANQMLATEHVVTLESLDGGAAMELFDLELKRVVENVFDLNTIAKTKRKISLEVVFAPTEDRASAQVFIDVKAKLAGQRGSATQVYFGKVDGRRVAVEPNKDHGLFDKPTDGKILPMKE